MRIGIGPKRFHLRDLLYYIVIVSSLGAAAVGLVKEPAEGLWILPALFTVCFVVVYTDKFSTKYSVIILNLIAFVRYVVLTYMYYFLNDEYVLPNGAVILSYISETIEDPFAVVAVMCVEMLTFYAFMFVAAHRIFKQENQIQENHGTGVLEIGVVVCGILLFVLRPQLSGGYRLMTRADASGIWGGFSILVFAARVFLGMWILRLLKYARWIRDGFKVLLSLAVLGILIIESAVGLTGMLSRWGFILAVIPALYLLQKSYPKYFLRILAVVGVMGLVFMIIMTASRYELAGRDDIGFFQRIINYKTFNTYFAGGVSMEIALHTNEVYGGEIGILTIVHDILGAFPMMNSLLDNYANSSAYYFNYMIYEGFIYGDQICPIGGQSILYFGEWAAGLLPGVFAVLAIWFEKKAECSNTIMEKYVYAYCMGMTAIIMCINVNIWFQFFWQKILPLLIIARMDYKIRIRR